MSGPVIAAWLVFLAGFGLWVRLRRPARPRIPWATPESRRLWLLGGVATIAVNAVFIPLWIISRPLAVTALFGMLVFALMRTFAAFHNEHQT